MVDSIGNDGANEGFWRFQIRDKNGNWVKMGGSVTFSTNHPNFGPISGNGTFEGGSRPGVALIKVSDNHPTLGGKVVEVPSEDFDSIRAIIPADAPGLAKAKKLDALDGIVVNAPTKADALKDSITGDEALQKIYASMGKIAKAEGRFAVGRSNKDIRAAAKETYKTVYEKLKVEYPDLAAAYPDYESYWDRASSGLAAGFDTRWADSVDEIDALTKASNKIYAREVLGLKEDGLIEFYRNSVNHMSSKDWAAAGYASLDRRMAWDYNSYISQYDNNGANSNDGRYIVRAKPEEVSGLIGFSQIEDEYGVVIGRDVVSQDGRAERVGNLEIQKVSPWSKDVEEFDRSGGGSPFRRVSPASQFEVFATETPVPGKEYADFYNALGLDKTTRPIPTKWDEMFGEGSFDALAAFPSYKTIQSYFVDAGDGKVGLDLLALDKVSSRNSTDPKAGDEYDTHLKMLSVIQELSGKTFMVHRGHRRDDPRIPDKSEVIDMQVDMGTRPTTMTAKSVVDNFILWDAEKYDLSKETFLDAKLRDIRTPTYEDARGNEKANPQYGLEEDVLKNGINVPIEAEIQDGKAVLLDGHTRLAIMFANNPEAEIPIKWLDAEPEVVPEVPKAKEPWKKIDTWVEDRGSFTLDKNLYGTAIDFRKNLSSPISAVDAEMITKDHMDALKSYTNKGYRFINNYLRYKDEFVDSDPKQVAELESKITAMDEMIVENGEVFENSRVFRGQYLDTPIKSTDTNWIETMENLEVGDIISDPGYMSTSNDPIIAFKDFGPGRGRAEWISDEEDVARSSSSVMKGSVMWMIDVPEGAKAFALPEDVGYAYGYEKEVILPRDSQLRVKGIRRVQQLDSDFEPLEGRYNYYVQADLIPQDTPGVIDVVDKLSNPEPSKEELLNSLPTKENATEDQIRAVTRYTHQAHDSINQYLRYDGGAGKVPNPVIDYSSVGGGKYVLNKWSNDEFAYTLDDVLEHIDSLDALIEQGPGLVEDTVLRRFIGSSGLSKNLLERLAPGDELLDKGFVSTSLATDWASDKDDWAIMIINAPKGTKGIYVDWFESGSFSNSVEQEVILDRGINFVVTKIEANNIYVDIKES
jgi:hypothetical protein